MAICIDRRQRLAAAMLLSAVDLPQPADEVAELWLEAARVCPGIKVDEVSIDGGRTTMLKAARDLIDELLSEQPAAACRHASVTRTIGGPNICDDCGAMV